MATRKRKPAESTSTRAGTDAQPPSAGARDAAGARIPSRTPARPSALLDTRIVYSGDCLDQLRKLPDASVDLIYIDPPFNSNRNYEVFWGETKEKRAFEDRHVSTLRHKCPNTEERLLCEQK